MGAGGAAAFLSANKKRAAVGYGPAEGGEGRGPDDNKAGECVSCLERRYNPDWEPQPRVSRGNRDGGQWTAIGSVGEGSVATQVISQLDIKPRSPEYLRCLDHCYAILERFQRPGVDANKWDFHRCMEECLGQKA